MNSYTGQVCDVSGFNDNTAEESIRIGTGLTVYDDIETGKSQLFVVHQGLDMRHCLDHSLANPNQARAFGIDWCDDPFDPNERPFGIKVEDKFFPFELHKSAAKILT